MPELPEVETVVRDLRPLLVGRVLSDLRRSRQQLRTAWIPKWRNWLRGRKVVQIDRRGKWIVIILDNELRLLVHLGMTGQLCVFSADEPTANHTHLAVTLDSGSHELRFRDIRRFGTAMVFRTPGHLEAFFQQSGLGPEPFNLPADYWQAQLADTQRCLKAVLLDQSVVAGVGNIYADESLFESRLPPWQIAATLEHKEAERLRRAVSKVLQRAIATRGSSIRNYVGGSGLQGNYQREFRVYGRTGEPCTRCGTPIERIRLAGRSTHFCPRCQANGTTAPLAAPSTSR